MHRENLHPEARGSRGFLWFAMQFEQFRIAFCIYKAAFLQCIIFSGTVAGLPIHP